MNLLPRLARVSLVMIVVLLCFSSVAAAETETGTATSTTYSTQGYLRFTMIPAPVSQAGYPKGNGSAEIQAQGTFLAVHFEAEGVARGAHLTLVLLANGISHSVANMTTSYDGEVEAEATVTLSAGSYSIGLEILDASSFSTPTPILVSSPSTQPLSLSQAQQTSTTTEQTQTATTVQEGETEDNSIRTAIQTKMIPAVVEVAGSGSSTYVNDGNFSASVGKYQEDGYLVSISATNVVGPRVVLVNMTSEQARSLFSGPVQVSLDGTVVPQASSLSQVLPAATGDQAKFVLVASPSALKLLILIPHFSYHTIAIVPVLIQAGTVLLYYAPVLLLSVATVTLVVLAAYLRRTRVAL